LDVLYAQFAVSSEKDKQEKGEKNDGTEDEDRNHQSTVEATADEPLREY
jgi:hypothetical protein